MPRIVWIMLIAISGPEFILQLAGAGFFENPDARQWRQLWVQKLAYFDQITRWMIHNNSYPAEQLMRFVSYSFVDRGFLAVLFNMVFLTAFGNYVAQRAPWYWLPLSFAAGAIGGALWITFIHPSPSGILIGAREGVFGLLGAMSYLMFAMARRNRTPMARAFIVAGAFFALQVIFELITPSAWAWTSVIGAFLLGFGFCALCAFDLRALRRP